MGRVVLVMFGLIPLVEIAGFILVGRAIGVWPTLAGVVLSGVLGLLVLRMQGLQLLNRMRATMERGEVPTREVADAMLIALAGVLLLIPGFFTDLLGFALLVPPIRHGIYALVRSRVTVVETTYTVREAGQRQVDHETIELDSDEWRPH